MRGQTLFNELTTNDEKPTSLGLRGRNKVLISIRNECLLYRYYYYARLVKSNFPDTLKCLSEEFFLSERTIVDILSNEGVKLKRITDEKMSIKKLIEKFNHLKWKTNEK